MNRIRRSVLLTAAAGAVVLGLLSRAEAQYQLQTDGRALDANNRLGSGGYNDFGFYTPPGVTGNQIVTGNVTGGFRFRDTVGYTDPRAFRGPTAGEQRDAFIRDSSGVPQPNRAPYNLNEPMPFYGESRAVPPPPGFVREGYTGGYVPAPAGMRQPQDWRLGASLDVPAPNIPAPGQYALPGPVDPTGGTVWDNTMRNVPQGTFGFGMPAPGANRTSSGAEMFRLQRTPEQAPAQDVTEQQLGGIQDSDGRVQAMSPPADALTPDAMRESLQNRSMSENSPTGGSMRHRVLTPGSRQGTQHAEMQRRADSVRQQQNVTDAEAYRQFRSELQAAQEPQERALTGGVAGPGREAGGMPGQTPRIPGAVPDVVTPGGETRSRAESFGVPDYRQQAQEQMEKSQRGTPAAPMYVPGATRQVEKPQPLKVRSLADGIEMRSLAGALTRAEQLMREGKYTAALDQYDAAEKVSPGNKLIQLGRANAELGAGYYARAEMDLYDAFASDTALLMGQYDLREMLGEQRLSFLVRDLENLAKTEPNQSRPLFLLAYIAYNTGREAEVDGYLRTAEQRSGPDPMYKLLREHWSLPAGAGNK